MKQKSKQAKKKKPSQKSQDMEVQSLILAFKRQLAGVGTWAGTSIGAWAGLGAEACEEQGRGRGRGNSLTLRLSFKNRLLHLWVTTPLRLDDTFIGLYV